MTDVTFITFEEGRRQRAERKRDALARYQPGNAASVYWKFLCENLDGLSINEVHPQSTNVPQVYRFFTTASQHVYGDCLPELLDRAIAAASRRKGKS
jgi:hypothetical protein